MKTGTAACTGIHSRLHDDWKMNGVPAHIHLCEEVPLTSKEKGLHPKGCSPPATGNRRLCAPSLDRRGVLCVICRQVF